MVSQRAPPTSAPVPANSSVATSISDFLQSKHLQPTQAWLNSFMASARSTALPSTLQKTAEFRILAADIVNCIEATAVPVLPSDVAKPEVQETRIPGSILVQVLDIEDVGQSSWSQVEAIEAYERGEFTKGREIIRLGPDGDESQASGPIRYSSRSAGPHKLLLQDASGTKVYAFEMSPIQGLDVQMDIGRKLLLTNVLVARGMLLLSQSSMEILGGKVDVWDREWRERRKEKLKQKARMGQHMT